MPITGMRRKNLQYDSACSSVSKRKSGSVTESATYSADELFEDVFDLSDTPFLHFDDGTVSIEFGAGEL